MSRRRCDSQANFKRLAAGNVWGKLRNMNGKDVQRKNVVNNVDRSSLWAP